MPLAVENTALEDASLTLPEGAVLIGIQKEGEGPPGKAQPWSKDKISIGPNFRSEIASSGEFGIHEEFLYNMAENFPGKENHMWNMFFSRRRVGNTNSSSSLAQGHLDLLE